MAVTERAGAWDVFEQFERDVLQLSRVGGLLNWDEQVNMPPRGAAARGEAKATLAGVLHERICDERFGEALAELGADSALGEFERARVREARRERDRAVRSPPALVRALAQAEAEGFEAWQVARAESDFSLFRDPLERIVSLRREEADAVGYEGGERYDALLDQYEPDMRVARLEPLLHGLRDELVPFAQEIAAQPRPDNSFLHRDYPAQEQRERRRAPDAAIGFDFEAGRQDESAHPFTSGFAPGDVRLTTREHEDDLCAGLFGVLHEAGHGLYEQGLTGAIEGTFAARRRRSACTSRSRASGRTWSGARARSGSATWARSRPRSPSSSRDVALDQFVRAVNLVEPSLIRVEADEVTYNLHVLLRFELELALLRGDLGVADLPGAWNERMRRSRHRGAERPRRRAAGRPLVGGPDRLLPDLHARHPLLGAVHGCDRARPRADRRDVRAGRVRPPARLDARARPRAGRAVAPEQIAQAATGEALGHAALCATCAPSTASSTASRADRGLGGAPAVGLVLDGAAHALEALEVRERLGQAKRRSWKPSLRPTRCWRPRRRCGRRRAARASCSSSRTAWCTAISCARAAGLLDQAAVAGVDDRRRELLDAPERLEVAAERVGLVVLPAPDVGRDLVEQHVAAEEPAAVAPEQRDVAVGVTRQDEHLERLARELEHVALVDEMRRLDRRDRQLVLLARRALGVLARHAVRQQVAAEARRRTSGSSHVRTVARGRSGPGRSPRRR